MHNPIQRPCQPPSHRCVLCSARQYFVNGPSGQEGQDRDCCCLASSCASLALSSPSAAEHGRGCCAITSLRSHLHFPITYILPHLCRLLSIRLRQALTIPVSHSHPCSPQMQWFLGLVIWQHLLYPTIPVTRAEGKHRSVKSRFHVFSTTFT